MTRRRRQHSSQRRTHPEMPARGDTGRAALLSDTYGRHRRIGLPRYYAINTVAEAIDVSSRTVRRWIANGDLVATRIHGVVRIADDDLRAFLALHREA